MRMDHVEACDRKCSSVLNLGGPYWIRISLIARRTITKIIEVNFETGIKIAISLKCAGFIVCIWENPIHSITGWSVSYAKYKGGVITFQFIVKIWTFGVLM